MRRLGLMWRVALLVSASLLVMSCGDDAAGEGTLRITLNGEEGAREGFPFTVDGQTVAFADGWSLRFDRYIVAVGDVSLRGADGATALEDGRVFIADLTRGAPTLLERQGLAARRWERIAYAIRAPGPQDEVVNVNEVAQADIARMRDGQLSYLIEGEATKGAQTVRLSWEVAAPVRLEDCTNGVDDTQGVVVRANTVTEAELTIHVEHAFFSSLGSEIAKLRFEAIAAASQDGQVVTWADLTTQDLFNLRGLDDAPLRDEAGARLSYDGGSAQLEATHLQAFVRFSMASQAHLNGLGLCTTRRLP